MPAWSFFGGRALRRRVDALEAEVARLRVDLLQVQRAQRATAAEPATSATLVSPERLEVGVPDTRTADAPAVPAAAPPAVPSAAPPDAPETPADVSAAPPDSPDAPDAPVVPVSAPVLGTVAAAPVPPALGVSAERLGLYVMAAVGGSAAVLAVLFALREVIAAGLLGPGARFALACFGGAAAWGVGEALRTRRMDVPANALVAAGAGMLHAALWAAHVRYGIVGAGVAFAGMVGVTAVTLLVAERRDSAFMALLAAAGGYATPVLLSSGEDRAVAFFGYLLVCSGGFVYTATRRGWTLVLGLCASAVVLLYLGWASQWRTPAHALVGLMAPLLLGAVFLWGASRRRDTDFVLVGGLGAVAVWGAGAVFLPPAVPLSVDPRSYLDLPWSVGSAGWVGTAYVALLAALLARATRGVTRGAGRGATLGAMFASAFAAALAALHAGAWGAWTDVLHDGDGWAPALGTLLCVPAALALGGTATGGAWAAVAVSGVLALVGPFNAAPWVELAWAGAALALMGTALALRTERRALLAPVALPAALLTTAPVAWHAFDRWSDPTAAPELPDVAPDGVWLLAVALAYTVAAHAASWRPRRDDLGGALSGAFAGVLFFLPLRAAWMAHLGPSALGLLGVLLGLGALMSAVALVRVVRVRDDDRQLAFLVAAALFFAGLAVPLQLERQWLTLGWTIEVALLAAATRRVRHPLVPVLAGALALLSFVRLVALPDSWTWGGGAGPVVLNWTLYTFGVPVVCYLLAASWLRTGPCWLPTVLRVLAGVAGFALVNAEVAHGFAHGGELAYRSERLLDSMARSLAWASYGLVLIGIGSWRESRAARLAGLGVALLGAGKVFVVDLWSLEGLARVGSLAGLALTLLVGAVAFSRIVNRGDTAGGKE